MAEKFTLEHIAIWCRDLEAMRQFYCDAFGADSGPMYHNLKTGFSSYFISFKGGGARLELMQKPGLFESATFPESPIGLAHFAICLHSEEKVNEMALSLGKLGSTIIRGPRRTGDGYYELETLDPEGNTVEITA